MGAGPREIVQAKEYGECKFIATVLSTFKISLWSLIVFYFLINVFIVFLNECLFYSSALHDGPKYIEYEIYILLGIYSQNRFATHTYSHKQQILPQLPREKKIKK